MPNAAKLIAALGLAALGWLVSDMIKPLVPFSVDFGWFNYVNAAIGVLVGWLFLGPRVGQGITSAINNGLTGIVVLVFWGVFVQGAYEMWRQALRNRYDGPFEAIGAIIRIGLKDGAVLLAPHIIATLLIGGVLAGLATEFAWRRWR